MSTLPLSLQGRPGGHLQQRRLFALPKDDSEERIEQQGATRLWWIPTPLDSPHDALREWELSHRTLIDLLPEDGDVAE
jgi:hypothetical protein